MFDANEFEKEINDCLEEMGKAVGDAYGVDKATYSYFSGRIQGMVHAISMTYGGMIPIAQFVPKPHGEEA